MRMKRIFSIGIVALFVALSANACVKKASVQFTRPLTVLVMDTTQALLDGAKVTVGKTVLTTSFDGRVVLKPEQLKGLTALMVEREGFKSAKVQEFKSLMVNDSTLIVRLVPVAV